MIDGYERSWSAGLPCVERRVCDADDVRRMRLLLEAETHRLVGGAVLTVAVPIALVVVAMEFYFSAVTCIGGLLLTIVIAMVAGDGLRRRGKLKRDLKADEIERFAGRSAALDLTEKQRFALRRQLAAAGTEVSFERLLVSGRILRFEGEEVPSWVAFDRTSVGSSSARSNEAAPALTFSESELHGGELRPLAGAERMEITALRKKLLRPDVATVFTVCYGLLGVVQYSRGATVPGSWPGIVVWVFAATLMVLNYHLRRRLRSALAADSKRGEIIGGRVDIESGARVSAEFLAESKKLWSVDGQPAPWRLDVRKRRGSL